MARKQTLKSILGGSDSREQVELNLGTPALNPTVQRAGQYRVAVQQTPKTNSALQLAQALRVTPQILGQANNIAKGLGADAALEVDNVEEAMLDDDAKGILGYNKAYQHGLVKRHFAMNEEAIRERFKNVAGRTNLPTGSTDADRMASINEFVSNLDKERDAFNQELKDTFGGDAHREEALQALSSTFVDGLYNEAMGDYKENLKQQTEMFISGDVQTMIKNQGVADALNYQKTELKALGVSGKLIGEEMRQSISASVAVDISQGRYREAAEKLAQAEAYKVTGNATLFGTAEGQQMKVKLLNSIERAQKNDEEDADERASDFANITADAYSGLRVVETLEDVSPTQKKVMMNSIELVMPIATPEELETAFEGIFSGTGTPIQNFHALLRETAVNGGDAIYDMYNDSRAKLDYQLQSLANRPISPVALTRKRKTEALSEFSEWHSKQTDVKTYSDWVKETGQPFRKFPELTELSNKLNAGGYVKDTLGFTKLGSNLNNLVKDIEGKYNGISFNDSIITNVQSGMEKQLLDYAASVADEPDSLALVEDKRKELFKDVTERLNGLAIAQSSPIDPLSPSLKEDLDNTSLTGGSGRQRIRYNSLKEKTIYNRSGSTSVVTVWNDINSDRAKMVKNNHLPQLGLSLTRFGFNSYSKDNAEMMKSAGLDSGDVNLGFGTPSNLGLTVTRFGEVLNADTGLNSLTDEQKTIREEYQALGIYDEATLEAFARAQMSLINE
jgi:hypothetical protein